MGSANHYSMANIADSALFSKHAMSVIKASSPDMFKEMLGAAKDMREMSRDHPSNPYLNSWYRLALNSVVAYAKQQGYVAVAWPEGGQVAMLYGGSMGKKIDTIEVNLKELKIRGANISIQRETEMTGSDMGSIRTNAQDGQYRRYSTDYLNDIVQEGGPNAEIAKRANAYLATYYAAGESEFATPLDELIAAVESDEDIGMYNGNMYLRLKEERLYNARLHKLLYNTMLPSAAKDIAKDSKAQKKSDPSVGHIFIKEAWNKKVRGRRGTGTGDGERVRGDPTGQDREDRSVAVSYTHLTLPTSDLV